MNKNDQERWEMVLVLSIVGLLVLFLLLWFVNPEKGHAHPHMILKCEEYVQHSQAEPVDSWSFLLINGLYSEGFDTNNDGKVDVQTLSGIKVFANEKGEVELVQHNDYPVFYLLDATLDGKIDYLITDVYMTGACSGLHTVIDASTKEGKTEMDAFLTALYAHYPPGILNQRETPKSAGKDTRDSVRKGT